MDDQSKVLHPDDMEAARRLAAPLINWLLQEAVYAVDNGAVIQVFSEKAIEAGFPLLRSTLHIRTLHPERYSIARIWVRGEGAAELARDHGIMESDTYRNSPLSYVHKSETWASVRVPQQLETAPFTIPDDALDLGCTHYLVFPLRFSDGFQNAATFASDGPEGFSDIQIEALKQIIPAYRSVLEIKALHRVSAELLGTYMGKEPVKRILAGQIQRGHTEQVDAVIWFSDMRDSTPLSERLSPDQMITMLNEYLAAMADSVYAEGGEVLRFIGDAALAIFRIDEGDDPADVCARAMEAAQMARRKMGQINVCRVNRSYERIRFGIGLHLGQVSYGNIGSAGRLEFTVIGANANLAARVESLTKTLDVDILLTDAVAKYCPARVTSLGKHAMKGVAEPIELFTLNEAPLQLLLDRPG